MYLFLSGVTFAQNLPHTKSKSELRLYISNFQRSPSIHVSVRWRRKVTEYGWGIKIRFPTICILWKRFPASLVSWKRKGCRCWQSPTLSHNKGTHTHMTKPRSSTIVQPVKIGRKPTGWCPRFPQKVIWLFGYLVIFLFPSRAYLIILYIILDFIYYIIYNI